MKSYLRWILFALNKPLFYKQRRGSQSLKKMIMSSEERIELNLQPCTLSLEREMSAEERTSKEGSAEQANEWAMRANKQADEQVA